MRSSRRSVPIAGSDAERQPSLQTTARTDLELLAVWLKSHVDGSDHTVRAYGRIGRRFLDALKVAGVDLRRATLDDVQTALETIRVKLGDRITEADWRLFTTLIRFDVVYHGHFKCNRSRLTDFPELWDYTRTLYQIPGVAETVRLDQVKTHYYGSHRTINPTGIVPKGPAIDLLAPTKRRATFRVPPNDARSLEGDREARRWQP